MLFTTKEKGYTIYFSEKKKFITFNVLGFYNTEDKDEIEFLKSIKEITSDEIKETKIEEVTPEIITEEVIEVKPTKKTLKSKK